MRRSHRLDLTGQVFGMLTVVSHAGKTARGAILWNCACACGATTQVMASNLCRGASKSCGCGQRASVTYHGMTGTPTFRSWDAMKQRCLNPKSPDFHKYGGRGIKICAEWLNSFDTFWQHMGTRPEGKTLDRTDNSGDYTPQNCRWSTAKAQAANRRSTRFVTYKGKTLALAACAEKFNIKTARLIWRLDSGWSVEKALETPVRPKRDTKKGLLQ